MIRMLCTCPELPASEFDFASLAVPRVGERITQCTRNRPLLYWRVRDAQYEDTRTANPDAITITLILEPDMGKN
jgi:hypothetical protein